MTDTNSNCCLVLVSDAEFSIATEVLLYSFRKYNPAFSGDVLIITDELPRQERDTLERFGPVRFVPPDPRLQQAVEKLQAGEPRLENIYRRLFSLEAFRLNEYERVVYLDSDMYCAGDLSELFTSDQPLLACPDGFTYGDRIRNLLPGADEVELSERYGNRYEKSFNAGVLSIGPPLLGDSSYAAVLDLLSPSNWHGLGTSKFTDQMILNHAFAGQFTELPAKYNYMVFIEEYQKCLEPVSFLDACLVHFAGAIKPWLCFEEGVLASRAPQFIKFMDAWRELLDEARASDSEQQELIARRFERQKEWIESYNQDTPVAVGRLY